MEEKDSKSKETYRSCNDKFEGPEVCPRLLPPVKLNEVIIFNIDTDLEGNPLISPPTNTKPFANQTQFTYI